MAPTLEQNVTVDAGPWCVEENCFHKANPACLVQTDPDEKGRRVCAYSARCPVCEDELGELWRSKIWSGHSETPALGYYGVLV